MCVYIVYMVVRNDIIVPTIVLLYLADNNSIHNDDNIEGIYVTMSMYSSV